MMNRTELEQVHAKLPGLVEQFKAGTLPRREFLRTSTLLGLSAAAAYGIVGGVDPVAAQERTGTMGGELRVGMAVMEITDPHVFDWSEKGNLGRQVLEPLASIGSDNVTRPYLAERWEASEDLSVWTFYLRQGVKWNNGDDFIADDVIATFERWMDSAVGSSNQGRFSALTVTEGDVTRLADGAIEKIDDHTVRFNMQRPFLAFPESLGDYPAMITHRDFVAMGANFHENPIGTGPYLMESISVGDQAVFVKRDPAEYWGPEVFLDRIRFVDTGGDPSAAFAALASGQVDILYTLDINLLPQVEAMPNLRVYDKTTAICGVARFRTSEPPFDNKLVRQAFQAAVDNSRVLELAYQNLGFPGQDHHVSPVHPEYTDLPLPAQDFDRARELLAEAGYPDGIEIDIVCVNDPKWESDEAQVLAEMVAPAGFQVNVQVLPGGTYWERWDTWPFSVTQWTTRALGVQVLSLAYRSGVAWNETAYNNPEFDALLNQAEATLDVEERTELVRQLCMMMQDDAIVVLPFFTNIYTASSDKVEGFAYHFAREFQLNDVSISA